MGIVTDSSGGALPGVTVTLSGPATPAPVVTDGSGRYLTPGLRRQLHPDLCAFGFETRTVTRVALGAGQTVVLDQQLGLGALSETVEVKAPAPPPPPPPPPAPPARVRTVAPPKPQAKPVDPEVLASVCTPRQAPDFSLAMGHVVSRVDDSGRQLIGPGRSSISTRARKTASPPARTWSSGADSRPAICMRRRSSRPSANKPSA